MRIRFHGQTRSASRAGLPGKIPPRPVPSRRSRDRSGAALGAATTARIRSARAARAVERPAVEAAHSAPVPAPHGREPATATPRTRRVPAGWRRSRTAQESGCEGHHEAAHLNHRFSATLVVGPLVRSSRGPARFAQDAGRSRRGARKSPRPRCRSALCYVRAPRNAPVRGPSPTEPAARAPETPRPRTP